MKTLGFVISHKNGEKRRALVPSDLKNIKNKEQIYFEIGYGESIGISDEEYLEYGVNMVSREEVFNCDIIVDPKIGDAEYIEDLDDGKILFGWLHAVQGVDFATKVLKKGHTAIAWEDMYRNGKHVFYRNNEIAGEAAVLHAFRFCGKMPYETKVAILGNGQTAKGAMRVLHGLGADVDIYGRKQEDAFKKLIHDYDVIVNCVLWDTSRNDRIIYKEDLKKLKKGTLIIDVSCDPNLEIETSHPTTIDDPVYEVDGVIHYAVDHTPTLYPITVSKLLSGEVAKVVDCLIADVDYPEYLKKAISIEKGHIIDKRITEFRTKRGLFCK